MRGPSWTKEEEIYLEEKWGTTSIPKIADHLGRSISSIKNKATRLNLSSFLESGSYITLNTLFKGLGIQGSYTTYKKKWIEAGLPVKRKKVDKCSFRIIDIDKFWQWAEKNRLLLDFKNFEENILGEEPDWVKEKRAIDVSKNIKTIRWTDEEEQLLKQLVLMFKYDYSELATRLNRTESAIKRRIHDLGLKAQPIKRTPRMWTDDEANTLTEMRNRGYSYEQIGEQLERTASAVRGKYERMINPEISTRAYRDKREGHQDVIWNSYRPSREGEVLVID